MIRQQISLKKKVLLILTSIALCVAGYSFLSYRQHKINPNDATIPGYKQLWKGIKEAVNVNDYEKVRWIVVDSIATFKRFFIGLGAAVLTSIILGVLMGAFVGWYAFFGWLLNVIALIPATAALAIFFVTLGTELSMYTGIIMFGTVPILARAIYLSIRDIRQEYLDKAATIGSSDGELIWEVAFKMVLPQLSNGLKLSVGPAMVLLIAAEWMCGGVGFGYRIRMQYKLLNMSVVYPYLVFLGCFMGLICNVFLKQWDRIVTPWHLELPTRKRRKAKLLRLLTEGKFLAEKFKTNKKNNKDSSGKIPEFSLEIKNLCQSFGSKNVLFDLDLRIKPGESVACVGPSGCGKSTLLRAILGTHPAKEGHVFVFDKDGNAKEIKKASRDIGIVYQKYTLYPFLTALENVAFGLMLDESSVLGRFSGINRIPFYNDRRGINISWKNLKKIHLYKAAQLLKKLKLEDSMTCYPHELSGGMSQRVAIAQALILKPKILLLDEPFGALDEATREELQDMLLELYAENLEAIKQKRIPPYTIIIVTHELNEAILVSDRVIGLTQYWASEESADYRAKGASTIVYDKVAPVFNPGDERHYETFRKQREQISEKVMNPKVLQNREDSRKFWQQIADGDGQGVLKNEN